MKIPYKMKKKIPNLLTAFRLVIAPIIVTFGFLNQVTIVLILTIIGCLTDLFDGFLARKWKVTSDFGRDLDMVSDKVFASCLVLSLLRPMPILLTVFILEVILSILNLFVYFKIHLSQTLFIGKVKTTSLFSLIVSAFIFHYFKSLSFLLHGLFYMTINLQILSFITYLLHFIYEYKKIEKPAIEDLTIHKKLMEETKEIKPIKKKKKKR